MGKIFWERCIGCLDLLVGLALFPLRFLLMGVAEVVAYAACAIACCGTVRGGTDGALPLSSWRRILVRLVVPPCTRVLLWTAGFLYIRVTGQHINPGTVLFVSNHSSMIDGILCVYLLGAPAFVAKSEGLQNLPLFGTICRALQLVYVDRQSSKSRQACSRAIEQRLLNSQGSARHRRVGPPLVIFPEGTTSGELRPLRTFRGGAFRPGMVCQPLVISYDKQAAHAKGVAEGETPTGLFGDLKMIVRLCLRVYNPCHVHVLAPYVPSDDERKDANLYAAQVRAVVQQAKDGLGIDIGRKICVSECTTRATSSC